MANLATLMTGEQVPYTTIACTWSESNQDGCGFCSGERCGLCLLFGGTKHPDQMDCEHDASERHMLRAD